MLISKNNQFKTIVTDIALWISKDFKEWPLRFCLEIVAWALSIGCAISMALTVPTPPLIILYPIWIAGCIIYAWASWTRGSVGMLANYLLLITIDTMGLSRMIIATL
jgi:hypothetical protein